MHHVWLSYLSAFFSMLSSFQAKGHGRNYHTDSGVISCFAWTSGCDIAATCQMHVFHAKPDFWVVCVLDILLCLQYIYIYTSYIYEIFWQLSSAPFGEPLPSNWRSSRSFAASGSYLYSIRLGVPSGILYLPWAPSESPWHALGPELATPQITLAALWCGVDSKTGWPKVYESL